MDLHCLWISFDLISSIDFLFIEEIEECMFHVIYWLELFTRTLKNFSRVLFHLSFAIGKEWTNILF